MKRIEFIGLPGSGKTTLASLVFKEIDKAKEIEGYYQLYQRSIKKHYKENLDYIRYIRFNLINSFLSKNHVSDAIYSEIMSGFLIKHYKIINELLDLVKLAPEERQKFLMQYFLTDIFRWEVIRSNAKKTNVIMEEGFIHRLVNMYVFGDESYINDTFFEFLETVQLPNVLVYIEQDIEVVLKRMNQRAKGIPKGLRMFSEIELIEILKTMREIINYIIPFLEKNNVKIIQIKNNNLKKAKNDLIREIEPLI